MCQPGYVSLSRPPGAVYGRTGRLPEARSTVTVSGVVRSAVIGEGLLYYRGKRYCLSDLNEEMNISKKYA